MLKQDLEYNKLFAADMKRWNLKNSEVAIWLNVSPASISHWRTLKIPMKEAYYALFRQILTQHLEDCNVKKIKSFQPKSIKDRKLRVPYKEIHDLYNEILNILPPSNSDLTNSQSRVNKNIKKLWATDLQDLEAWAAYFKRVSQVKGIDNITEWGWQADLEYITRKTTYDSIMTGWRSKNVKRNK